MQYPAKQVEKLKHQVYTFILGGRDGHTSLAFCETNFSKEEARRQIETVLAEKKGLSGQTLGYMGILDYHDMEPQVNGQLGAFEKYDPVWLFGVQ